MIYCLTVQINTHKPFENVLWVEAKDLEQVKKSLTGVNWNLEAIPANIT
jgi:hypothetical protein